MELRMMPPGAMEQEKKVEGLMILDDKEAARWIKVLQEGEHALTWQEIELFLLYKNPTFTRSKKMEVVREGLNRYEKLIRKKEKIYLNAEQQAEVMKMISELFDEAYRYSHDGIYGV